MLTNIFSGIAALILLFGCSATVEPIQFGQDDCDHCRMKIMDTKFGAAILTTKGKTYKFDDVNCLANYISSGSLPASDVAEEWIVDFGNPKSLILVKDAHFVYSEKVKSPMASHVAAFADITTRDGQLTQWNGDALTWDEVKSLFNE